MLIIKEISLLVSPVLSVRPQIVEPSARFHKDTETNTSYVWSTYIGKRSSTASRFEYFAEQTEAQNLVNWGFVSINDTNRKGIVEIGLEDELFDNIVSALAAYGAHRCLAEIELSLYEFVPDVLGGRGAVLACAPEIYMKNWSS